MRLLSLLTLFTLSSLAAAQRVTFPNGAYDLQACYHVTQVTRCDFTYTPLQE